MTPHLRPPDDAGAAPRGFTLIEVAAALAIAAGALVVLMQVFGDGGRHADRATLGRLALLTAQSALAGAGAEGPLAAGARWGGLSAEGLAWEVSVDGWPAAAAGAVEPLHVVATVRDPRSGTELARLATIRLGPPAAQDGTRAR